MAISYDILYARRMTVFQYRTTVVRRAYNISQQSCNIARPPRLLPLSPPLPSSLLLLFLSHLLPHPLSSSSLLPLPSTIFPPPSNTVRLTQSDKCMTKAWTIV